MAVCLHTASAHWRTANVSQRLWVTNPGQLADDSFDLVFANILAQPLFELTRRFADLLRAGGWIVLTGILVDQAAALADAYETWFDMSRPVRDEAWALVAAKRGNDV